MPLALQKETNERNDTILLGCRLCEKYRMIKNANGKENTWATRGFNTLTLDKIKEHRLNEKLKETEQLELQITSMSQPNWISKRVPVLSLQEESVQNLMYCSIYLCQRTILRKFYASYSILWNHIYGRRRVG